MDMAAYMRERYASRKQEAVAYLGGVCVGCSTDVGLEFHHKNPDEKEFTVSGSLYRMSLEVLKAELDKCELRCEDCHKAAHAWKHGTLAGYRYCRCVDCKAAKAEYSRQYKQKRKAAQESSRA